MEERKGKEKKIKEKKEMKGEKERKGEKGKKMKKGKKMRKNKRDEEDPCMEEKKKKRIRFLVFRQSEVVCPRIKVGILNKGRCQKQKRYGFILHWFLISAQKVQF